MEKNVKCNLDFDFEDLVLALATVVGFMFLFTQYILTSVTFEKYNYYVVTGNVDNMCLKYEDGVFKGCTFYPYEVRVYDRYISKEENPTEWQEVMYSRMSFVRALVSVLLFPVFFWILFRVKSLIEKGDRNNRNKSKNSK